jgi:hypothetical protein
MTKEDFDSMIDIIRYEKEAATKNDLWIEIKKLQDDSNLLSCLRSAGIDNAESYSYGK